jgi:hypothetical protein
MKIKYLNSTMPVCWLLTSASGPVYQTFFLERTAKALPRILLDDKKKNKNLYREKTA